MKTNNKQHKKKVFLIQEILADYRVPVFRRLSDLDGIDLTVFFSYLSKLKKKEGIREAEKIDGFRYKVVPHISIGRRVFLPTLVWHIVKEHPDVVISGVMAYSCLFTCKLLRIPFIWWTGVCPSKNQLARKNMLCKLISGLHIRTRLFLKSDAIIVYSEEKKKHLVSTGAYERAIFIAYNSLDTDSLMAIAKEVQKSAQPLVSKGDRVIFVGRLIKSKRVDILLRAFKIVQGKLRNAELFIVGDGPEKCLLETLAVNLDLKNVKILSINDKKVLGRYLMSSSVFVLPSLGGLAINEAMCFGLPVVCTEADGTEKQLLYEGRNGLYTKPGDVVDLASKIEKILKDNKLQKQMAKESLKIIRDKVNVHTMLKGFEDAIQYVTTKGR
ncbi:D-inositol-3-phosphate glycosyltransferase [subsurface metagenome]